MNVLRCIRERVLLFGQLSSLCPALSGGTSRARQCVCVCVRSPFVQVFLQRQFIPPSPTFQQHSSILDTFQYVMIICCTTSARCKKSVLCAASHLPNAANCLYVKQFLLFVCLRHINVDLSRINRDLNVITDLLFPLPVGSLVPSLLNERQIIL